MTINKTNGKVVIIGSGAVGASAAFAMSIGDIVSEIVVIDLNYERAFGEALDISHGLSLVGSIKVHAGGFEDVRDADIIVISAGSPRKPGETRIDLLKKNETIARDVTRKIMEYYNGGVILVISNPVDVLTYVIQKESGLPKEKVFGSGTMLDTSRFQYLIADNFGCNSSDVNAFMIGEHGESVVPVWSLVSVKGIPLDNYCAICKRTFEKGTIEEEVRAAGAKIIKFKGATYYAIALIIARLVKAVLKNQNTIFPISSVIDGPFGIKNVALSLPTVINSLGISQVLEIDLSNNEKQKLLDSAQKLKNIQSDIG